MAVWKQLFGIIIACGAIGFVLVTYVPGAREYLVARGVLLPVAEATAGKSDKPQDGKAGANGGGGGRSGPRTPLVVVQPAAQAVINDRISALGTGAAVKSATLVPSDSGILTELRVTSGQSVTAGEVIAMLNPASAQVAYDTAKITRDDAERTLERNQRLGSGALVSATQLQAFQFTLDKAELTLRQAEIDLANRKIVSPIAGTLGIIRVNTGVEVSQSTVIATVEDNSAIKVSYQLPERFIGKIKVGDPVSAVSVARPGVALLAKISAVDNRVDDTTGAFEVEASISNDTGSLQSGMSFTMTMQFAGDTFIAVPPLAVQWGADGPYVWRVTEDKAARVPVGVVQRNAENVLVTGGLAVGDLVVTEGVDAVKDGAAVQIAGAPAKPAAGN